MNVLFFLTRAFDFKLVCARNNNSVNNTSLHHLVTEK